MLPDGASLPYLGDHSCVEWSLLFGGSGAAMSSRLPGTHAAGAPTIPASRGRAPGALASGPITRTRPTCLGDEEATNAVRRRYQRKQVLEPARDLLELRGQRRCCAKDCKRTPRAKPAAPRPARVRRTLRSSWCAPRPPLDHMSDPHSYHIGASRHPKRIPSFQ